MEDGRSGTRSSWKIKSTSVLWKPSCAGQEVQNSVTNINSHETWKNVSPTESGRSATKMAMC